MCYPDAPIKNQKNKKTMDIILKHYMNLVSANINASILHKLTPINFTQTDRQYFLIQSSFIISCPTEKTQSLKN